MEREFVGTKIFDKQWGELKFTDDDMKELEAQILGEIAAKRYYGWNRGRR